MSNTGRAASIFLGYFTYGHLLLLVPHFLPARLGQLTVTRLRAAIQTILSRLPGTTPRFLTRFLPSGRPRQSWREPCQIRRKPRVSTVFHLAAGLLLG
jgi:hypothetical protein